MSDSNDKIDRSVHIGGDASGNVIQTGDQNIAWSQYQRVTLPPPETVDIHSELDKISELLSQLNSPHQNKITNAFSDIEDELTQAVVNQDEIGGAFQRAIDYAQKADGFINLAESLKPHVTAVVSWLGDNWHKLLPIFGLSL